MKVFLQVCCQRAKLCQAPDAGVENAAKTYTVSSIKAIMLLNA